MGVYLGIDTSNYTTSLCCYHSDDGTVRTASRVLKVKQGMQGLRQSEALFQHTVNLPELFDALAGVIEWTELAGVGVSTRPRRVEGSYMPCFLAGVNAAKAAAAAADVPCHAFSHQEGHIMAAVSGQAPEVQQKLLTEPFLALHLSGGTTELLQVQRDAEGFACEIIGGSRDISVGQLVDRAGVAMGMTFPCGKELDDLSKRGSWQEHIRIRAEENWVNLSGFENQVQRLLKLDCPHENVAAFTLEVVTEAILQMLQQAPALPLLMMGGVASNSYLRSRMAEKARTVYFAAPERSRDNAIGIAVLAAQ